MAGQGWGQMPWGGQLISGGGGSGSNPLVQNFSPSDGTPITPQTALDFDVVSTVAFTSIVITVNYPTTGVSEVIYDKNGFTSNFQPFGAFAGSVKTNITGGYHFTIRRRGGWYTTPQIVVQGSDVNGVAITQ